MQGVWKLLSNVTYHYGVVALFCNWTKGFGISVRLLRRFAANGNSWSFKTAVNRVYVVDNAEYSNCNILIQCS